MKTNHCKIVDCTIRDGGLVNSGTLAWTLFNSCMLD